jgi:uncharacterized protein (TIGR00251 family)
VKAELLRVRIQPRAGRSAIVGWRADGALSVRVAAPPVDGQANDALIALLAASLGLRPSAVTIAHGTRARDKLVRVAGLSAAEIRRMLGWEASTRPSNSHGGLDMAPKPPALVTPRGTRGVPRRNASFTDSGS